LRPAACNTGNAEKTRATGRDSFHKRFTTNYAHGVMLCIYNGDAAFDWDDNNLRKIQLIGSSAVKWNKHWQTILS
jgi:hypothetical protein